MKPGRPSEIKPTVSRRFAQAHDQSTAASGRRFARDGRRRAATREVVRRHLLLGRYRKTFLPHGPLAGAKHEGFAIVRTCDRAVLQLNARGCSEHPRSEQTAP